jgi:hypothetical protein
MRRLAILPTIALLAVGRPASATPSARLVYVRSAQASSCPDETALRGAVAARFGYDPFFAWAKQTVVVEVWRRDKQYASRVQIVDAKGVAGGARELTAAGPSCDDLFDATALAISIALDANKADVAAPEPEPSMSPAPAPASPPPVPPPREPAPDVAPRERPSRSAVDARPVSWLAGVDLLGSDGTAPTVSAGMSAFAELRLRRFSTALEARLDAPASTKVGDAHSWLYAAQLVPCFHVDPVFACALGAVGQFVVSADVSSPSSGSALLAALGARLGAEWPVTTVFSLRPHADGLYDLAPPHYRLAAADVWDAPRLAVTVGLGAAVRIP